MKKLIFSISIFCFLILSANEVFACSCELPSRKESLKKQVKKAFEKSAAVFYGEVLEIIQKPETFYVTVKFKVEKAWKNQLYDELIIQTGQGRGDCGYQFEIGRIYLVYAYRNEINFGTSICQRTSESDDDSKYLDEIKRPKLFLK